MTTNRIISGPYHRDDTLGLWLPNGQRADYHYSDGDAVEDKLLTLMQSAADTSLYAPELAAQIVDYPTRYHLSPQRANLLRPLQYRLQGKKVLELGAGCGAITRYLGEIGAEVTAVEGSQRRAAITAARCRDLPHVQVVCDQLQNFLNDLPAGETFDAVLMIGVLEYTKRYMDGTDPIGQILQMIRARVAPGGILAVAIENQLGLRYFAGMLEDHNSVAMYGINDAYGEKDFVTFGRQELTDRLVQAGFASAVAFVPLPDYKLPVNVVTPQGCAISPSVFDVTPLARIAVQSDELSTGAPLFSQEQALGVIVRNGLLAEFANSFLMVAETIVHSAEADHTLAYHYSTARLPVFCKETRFTQQTDNQVTVARHYLFTHDSRTNGALTNALSDEAYTPGALWSDALLPLLTRPGWTVDKIADWARVWIDALQIHMNGQQLNNLSAQLPGDVIDLLPYNLIVGVNGQQQFIDQEWQLANPVEFGFLLFRGIVNVLVRLSAVATPVDARHLTFGPLLTDIFAALGYTVSDADFQRYAEMEAAFGKLAHGTDYVADYGRFLAARELPLLLNVGKLAHLTGELYNKDLTLQSQSARLQELEGQHALRTAQLNDLQEQHAALYEYADQRMKQVQVLESELEQTKSVGAARSAQLFDLQNQHDELYQRISAAYDHDAERATRIADLEMQNSMLRAHDSAQHELQQDLLAQLAQIRHDLSARDEQLLTAQEQLSTLQKQFAAAHEQLRSVMESTSWRVTQPLRSIVATARRGKNYVATILTRLADASFSDAESNAPLPYYSLDHVNARNGRLYGFGWAYNPDHVIAKITLVCTSPNQTFMHNCEYNVARDDVAAAYGEAAMKSGFAIGCQLPDALWRAHQVGKMSVHLNITYDNAAIAQVSVILGKAGRASRAKRQMRALRHMIEHARQGEFTVIAHKITERLRRRLRRAPIDKTTCDLAPLLMALKDGSNPVVSLDPSAAAFLTALRDWKQHAAPVTLIFDHQLGGGANHYRDILLASPDYAARPVMLFTYDVAGMRGMLSLRDHDNNWQRVAVADPAVALEQLERLLAVREILVNNLYSFEDPLDLVRTLDRVAKRQKARLRVAAHDHFAICPSYALLDHANNFCGVPDNLSACRNCLSQHKGDFNWLMHVPDIAAWRTAWRSLLLSADEILVFSNATRNLYRRAYPQLDVSTFVLRPHTVDYINRAPVQLDHSQPLHIGIVGDITVLKGAEVVRELCEAIVASGSDARVTIIGRLHIDYTSPVLTVTGPYVAANLPHLIENSGVNLMFFSSICPETFSYVTEELMQMNLPVLAFDIGAPAERLLMYENGHVIPMTERPNILQHLQNIHADLARKHAATTLGHLRIV